MNFEAYLLLFSAAFIASLSHCTGMCGGIVLGFNMQKFDSSKILQALANILYFFGRMCSYIVIGLCFVLVGKSFSFGNIAEGIILIVLGILLFFSAFIITFCPKLLGNVLPSGKYAWYKEAFSRVLESRNIASFFFIGVLNGLLPCHLVYMFALKAADSLSIWHAILTMVIFSFATFLPLFCVGMFSASLLQSKFRTVLLWIAFVIMSYFAFVSISNGVNKLMGQEMDHSMHMMHPGDAHNHDHSANHIHDDSINLHHLHHNTPNHHTHH